MHQHPNIADGIVMMADDAEVTNGEGVVEALADLRDNSASARTSDDAITTVAHCVLFSHEQRDGGRVPLEA